MIDPPPKLSGWSFKRGESLIFPVPAHDPMFTLQEWVGGQNLPEKDQRTMGAALRKAGFVVGRALTWKGKQGRNHSFAQIIAYLFRTAAGAQSALKWLHTPQQHRTSGPGQGAWMVSKQQIYALLTWQQGNVVFSAGMNCTGLECPFSPAPVVRQYATQIMGRV
jgi:hypothetical protein